MRKTHAAKHVIGLGELDVRIADDLDQIAPGVAEVEKWAGRDLDPGGEDRGARRFLVLDHQAEVAAAGRGGIWRLLQREELVAEVDEGHAIFAAAKLEAEEVSVEIERLVDVPHLDCDMVEPDEAGFAGVGHEMASVANGRRPGYRTSTKV